MNRQRLSDKQQKKLADDARLLRAWRTWHSEERAAALAGPHGPVLAELFRAIDNLAHLKPSQLVGLVRTVDWTVIDYDSRYVVLHELNTAITKLRERHGLPAIEDPLPGQTDNAYRIVKAIMTSSPSNGEARRAHSAANVNGERHE
jgi:hypothetical protein